MSILEDIFTVTAVDPDGKIFDRGIVSDAHGPCLDSAFFSVYLHPDSVAYQGDERELWDGPDA